ncbi:hypothetical protein SteCoe_36335 [Stentor coeruleus]|uniref:Palmitoyltransferase n=1 Tax=Stentor coeruleus TaxID=5963 RepID=A0A1R2AQD8_9CILI|nr:hypothetical protein SteCoe_36335 [Stentor coeruleus]
MQIPLRLKIPLIMLSFQLGLLACLAYVSEDLRNLHNPWSIFFWIFSLISFTVYFYATQTVPGFIIQHDTNVLTAKGGILSEDHSISCSVEVKDEIQKKKSQTNNFVIFNGENPEDNPDLANKRSESINTERSDDEEEDKENSQSHNEISIVKDIQITEIRHCTVCKIDQPMRAKHCRECGHCVATHDHHCPWLGVCIGERNKKVFYVYLAFQFTHIVWALTLVRVI